MALEPRKWEHRPVPPFLPRMSRVGPLRLLLCLVSSVSLPGFARSSPGTSAAEDAPKRVLVLYSFGRDYFNEFADGFQAELDRLSPEPVAISEVSLETARSAETTDDTPFLDYLRALFSGDRVDLLVAVAGPAARFGLNHRDVLFPSAPLVVAGVERRVLAKMPPAPGVATVPVVLDFPPAIENILRLTPDTTEIVVVLGGSAISRFWLSETQREFEPFSSRVRFTWLHDLPLDEMRKRVAALPPHRAILFGEYGDAAGMANDRDRALASLHAVSSAPIFGLFESQLGRGIVGGPLLSETEASRRAAATARRILNGEAPESIESRPVTAGRPVYDFRELQRWGIAERLLPPGSRVSFRPPSPWERYRGTVLLGLGIMGLQTVLIGGLLLQRSRRRVAEEEVRALARRLLTAHEDEKRGLARELHDDLSQRLARLAIDAAGVERSISASGGDVPVRAMRDALVRLSEDVHDLSYQLHPSVLDDLGLKQALEVECDRFSRRESIRAELASFAVSSELPPDVAVCLFRIAQEALRNAARHSRAGKVSLEVGPWNGGVRMTVKDDGVGFDAGRRVSLCLGHASMRERAALVRGTLEVESTPGRGTAVKVTVPLSVQSAR